MSEIKKMFGDIEVATLSLTETQHPINIILLTIGAAILLVIFIQVVGWLMWRRKMKKKGEPRVEI